MRSGFLAGHSTDPPLPLQFPSQTPACRTVPDLWYPAHCALVVRHTQLLFKADGTASRCQCFPKIIGTYEEVKSYWCFGRHCSVVLYRWSLSSCMFITFQGVNYHWNCVLISPPGLQCAVCQRINGKVLRGNHSQRRELFEFPFQKFKGFCSEHEVLFVLFCHINSSGLNSRAHLDRLAECFVT